MPKQKVNKQNYILALVLTRNQTSANDFDSDCAVVDSFKDEEIKEAQMKYSDLSRFTNLTTCKEFSKRVIQSKDLVFSLE